MEQRAFKWQICFKYLQWLVNPQRVTMAPSKEPSVTNQTKRPLKLHRCRICLNIFASGDFLSKHVAQTHSEELIKQTLKVKQDFNETVNKTSEHAFVRSENQVDGIEHQLRCTEHQFESHEPNFKKSEHQFGNSENQPVNDEHLHMNTEVWNTEHHLEKTEHSFGISENELGNTEYLFRNTEHQLGNNEHQLKDEVNVVIPKVGNQNPQVKYIILGERTSIKEEEEFGMKEEQQLKQEEEQWQEEEERWKTAEQQSKNKLKSLKEGEWIKKEKEEEEDRSLMTVKEEQIGVDEALRARAAWRDWNGSHWLCICGLQFKVKSHLDKHQLSCPTYIIQEQRHGGSIGGLHFWCMCGGRYKYKSYLKQHQKTCPSYNMKKITRKDPSPSGLMDVVQLWCICGMRFKVQSHLEYHQTTCCQHLVKQQGGSLDGMLLFCMCGFRFKIQKNLEQHQITCRKYISREHGGSVVGSLKIRTSQEAALDLLVHRKFRNVRKPYRRGNHFASFNQSIVDNIKPEHRNPVVVLYDCMKGVKEKQKTTFHIVNKKPRPTFCTVNNKLCPTEEESYSCPNCHKRFRSLKFLSLHQTNGGCYARPSSFLSVGNPRLPGPIRSNGVYDRTIAKGSIEVVPGSFNSKEASGTSKQAFRGSSRDTLPGTVKQMIPGYSKDGAPGKALSGCSKGVFKELPLTKKSQNRNKEMMAQQAVVGEEINMAADVKTENEAESDGEEAESGKEASDYESEKSKIRRDASGMSSPECYKCNLCDRKFYSEILLMDHTKHRYCSFLCTFCGRTFSSSESLQKHKRDSSHCQYFLCHVCDMRFMEHTLLDYHVKSAHPRQTNVFYCCALCKIEFANEKDQDKHMEQHYGKVHTCGVCDRGFLKPGNLQKHSETHARDRRHKCRFCKVRFTCAQNLKDHTKACHGLDGEYHGYLKDHVRMRRKGCRKPYSCNLCHYSFAWLSAMTAHFEFHQNSFDCTFCGAEMASEQQLLCHLKQTHKQKNS